MRFLPVFLDLEAGTVMLVGSDEAARTKLRLLRAAGAHVRWFSCEVDVAEEILAAMGPQGGLDVSFADPLTADLSGVVAVVSAAGPALDPKIAALARARSLPVNVVDRPDLSTFIFPAIVDRGEVVVAIGTGGAAPVLAQRVRERIEALLPSRIGDLAVLMGRYREQLSARIGSTAARRRFWQRVSDGPIAASFLSGEKRAAEAELARAIDDVGRTPTGNAGAVFLVGAGPGDPDLLTLRALHVLAEAELVLYDERVTPAVLDRARRDAERIFVRKRQPDEINGRLIAAARAGRRAVYLRGGDPFGSDQPAALRAAGVPVVVVPGIALGEIESDKEAA